jgi:hypothetical protein
MSLLILKRQLFNRDKIQKNIKPKGIKWYTTFTYKHKNIEYFWQEKSRTR